MAGLVIGAEVFPGREPGPEVWLNSGGPMSRTRSVRIVSSLLGKSGAIRCPRVMQVGLNFGRTDPVEVVRAALATLGIADPEELRTRYEVPDQPCICREARAYSAPLASRLSRREVLRHALILGLSTAFLYDPGRPVMLTRASLTRRLELYSGEGFYV